MSKWNLFLEVTKKEPKFPKTKQNNANDIENKIKKCYRLCKKSWIMVSMHDLNLAGTQKGSFLRKKYLRNILTNNDWRIHHFLIYFPVICLLLFQKNKSEEIIRWNKIRFFSLDITTHINLRIRQSQSDKKEIIKAEKMVGKKWKNGVER